MKASVKAIGTIHQHQGTIATVEPVALPVGESIRLTVRLSNWEAG